MSTPSDKSTPIGTVAEGAQQGPAVRAAALLGIPLPRLFQEFPQHSKHLRALLRLREGGTDEAETTTRPPVVVAQKVDVFTALATTEEITGPSSPWKLSMGAMREHAVLGQTQDTASAAPVISTPDRFVGWMRAARGVGFKFEAGCFFTGHFKGEGDTHATNCLLVQATVLDFDTKVCKVKHETLSAIRDDAALQKVLAKVDSIGMNYGFTTSSHGRDGICFKVVIWWRYPIPYQLAYLLGQDLRLEFAAVLDIDPNEPDNDGTKDEDGNLVRWATRWKCLDPVCERPVQCQLQVKNRTPELAALGWDRWKDDLPVADPTERIRRVLQRLEEREEARTIKEEVRVELGLHESDAPLSTSLDSRQSWAQGRLKKLGPAVEGSGGNDRTFLAIRIGVLAGLTTEEFWPVLRAWNQTCAPPWADHQLSRKLEGGYRTTTAVFGAGIRPAEQTLLGTLDPTWDGTILSRALQAQAVNAEKPSEILTFTKTEPATGVQPLTGAGSLSRPPLSLINECDGRDKSPSGVVEFDLETVPSLPSQPPPRLLGTTTVEVVCERYLPTLQSFSELKARTTFIKSPYGTGKNFALLPAWQELLARGGEGVALNHRRSLVRATAAQIGIRSHLDSDEELLVGSIASCVHSVGRIGGDGYEVVILDESESVAHSLFHGPLRNRHLTGQIMSYLQGLLVRSKRHLFLDNDLGRCSILLARTLLGTTVDKTKRDEHQVINVWKPKQQKQVHFWADSDGWREDLISGIERRLDDPDSGHWVGFTSKTELQAVEKILRARFPSCPILAVHAGTSGDPQVWACLDNPAEFSNYKIVLASPTVGTGVSVDHKGRWRVYLHARSGAGPNAKDVGQMLHRVRHPVNTPQIWVGGTAPQKTTSEARILARSKANNRETITRLVSLGSSWDTRYTDLGKIEVEPDNKALVALDAAIEADRNRWTGCFGNHVRRDKSGDILEVIKGSLVTLLEEQDVDILYIGAMAADPKAAKAEHKAAKEEVEADRREALKAAEPTSVALALTSAGLPRPPPGAAIAAEAALLREFYGLSADTPLTDEKIDRDDHGRHRAKVKRWNRLRAWQTLHRQAVLYKDRKDLRAKYTLFLSHHANETETTDKLLGLFGITNLLEDARAGLILPNPGMIAANKKLRKEVAAHLDLHWTAEHVKKPFLILSTLLDRVGVKLGSKPVRLPNGKRGREYWLDLPACEAMDADATADWKRLVPSAPAYWIKTPEMELEILESLAEASNA